MDRTVSPIDYTRANRMKKRIIWLAILLFICAVVSGVLGFVSPVTTWVGSKLFYSAQNKSASAAKGVFAFISGLALTLIISCYRAMLQLYLAYMKDMREQECPVVKFRYFFVAPDILVMQKNIEGYQEEQNRNRRKQRESLVTAERAARRLGRAQPEMVQPDPDSPEQIAQRRQRKMASFCVQLRDLTPPEHFDEAERVCIQAQELTETDFKKASRMLTRAIDDRKRMNEETAGKVNELDGGSDLMVAN